MESVLQAKELTFGQKKAGLTLNQTKVNRFDAVVKIRIFYANIFDTIYQDMEEAENTEQKRLAEICIDENVNALRSTIRALTFAHD